MDLRGPPLVNLLEAVSHVRCIGSRPFMGMESRLKVGLAYWLLCQSCRVWMRRLGPQLSCGKRSCRLGFFVALISVSCSGNPTIREKWRWRRRSRTVGAVSRLSDRLYPRIRAHISGAFDVSRLSAAKNGSGHDFGTSLCETPLADQDASIRNAHYRGLLRHGKRLHVTASYCRIVLPRPCMFKRSSWQ